MPSKRMRTQISWPGKHGMPEKGRDEEDKESRVTWLMKTGHNKSAASELIHLFFMVR